MRFASTPSRDGKTGTRSKGTWFARNRIELFRLAGAFLPAHHQTIAFVEARANTEVLTVGPPAGLSEGMALFFGGGVGTFTSSNAILRLRVELNGAG
jgi:hypothetical protein